jgi:hypothetical protein
MTKTQTRKLKRRIAKRARVRLVVLAVLASAFAFAQHSSVKTVSVMPSSILAPMGFMLTEASPVKDGGTPVGMTTDFFGLPVDPEHPSMGAIQYHEMTPDYMELVRKILIERHSHSPALAAEIEDLFFKVYGYRRQR